MQGSVSHNLPQTTTASSTPVAINLPHSWGRRINTMVTDTAFPMEPNKQCKRRTDVHYHSGILHKISIHDQQGSLGREHRGNFHSAGYFLRPFTPNEDNYQEQQQVIFTDYMLEIYV